MYRPHVVIGSSAAGVGAIYTLQKLDPTSRIICISHEQEEPYNKCFMVDYLSNTRERDSLLILTSSMRQSKSIEYRLGTTVTLVDPSKNMIFCSNGLTLFYNTLCIATGCLPIMPKQKSGKPVQGIFTFYHLADVDKIRAYIIEHNVSKAVVVGAGFTGLEAADGLRSHNVNVVVIDRGPHVLPNNVDESGAALIQKYMNKAGVQFYPYCEIVDIQYVDDTVSEISLSNGLSIQTQMIIYAIGVKPNTDFLLQSGVTLNNNYIQINKNMQTSVPGIFAAGDCAVLIGYKKPNFTWPIAMNQGVIAAHTMVGKTKTYMEMPAVISSSFFGIKFASCCLLMSMYSKLPDQCIIKTIISDGFYYRYVYIAGSLKGFLLIGNTQQLAQLRREIVV